MKNVFEKIKQSKHLPQLPQVMLKLVKVCSNDKANIEELIEIISTDPSLTSKLFQIISSPYVNFPKEVNNIKTAVVYLGLDTIKNIAISSSAMHFFSLSKKLPGFDIIGFWYHSYKCGLIAGKIARENNLPDPDAFFLAGLLHDIGRLVLMQTFPKEYGTILQTAVSEKQMTQAEMVLFGVDTSQVSAWLFSHWNLSSLTSEAVFFTDESLDKIGEELVHGKIIYMANIFSGPAPMEDISWLLPLTGISEIRIGQILAEAEDEVLEMAKNLGIKLQASGDKDADGAIALEMKNLALFHGTLQNLLGARDIPAVLDIIQKGLKIIFNVSRVFFFFLDGKKKILTGNCSPEDKNYKIVRRIAVPMSNRTSLLVKSLTTCTIQTSFQTSKDTKSAISDTRIIRLLETGGVYCIPIVLRGEGLGVMVLGVDKDFLSNLNLNRGLLTLFSKQAGMCIQNIGFHREYAANVSEKKMEAYATLTDKVIHEINNPISIIKNYLETLSLKLPDKHPAQEELSIVGEEVFRVSSLIEGLSSFSKPKIGGFELIDINRLCTGLFDVLEKTILLPRQIQSDIHLGSGIPDIKTDGNGLKQVIINLVKNAAEAMKNGGKIDIQTRFLPESAKIFIDEKKRLSGSIEICIRDNGPGIKSCIKEKLFEPYNSTKTGKNSGLGLTIVHSIVKELGGQIICDSKQGQGTCFSIYLPITPNRPAS
ncbi:MAG: HDOD domain-containing protein [Desulfobacteraceae bacterium]|nr:HDOD domain-containing protein [Desulfobacteraceae bacterium]